MLDSITKKICQKNPEIRDLKIKNIKHAVDQAEKIISESNMNPDEIIFLKKRIAESKSDLEILNLMNN